MHYSDDYYFFSYMHNLSLTIMIYVVCICVVVSLLKCEINFNIISTDTMSQILSS